MNRTFIVNAGELTAYRRRERVLVAQGATSLIVQFVAWLGLSFIGFTLLLWPFLTDGITRALTVAGSSMTGVGLPEPTATVPPVILFAAAASGLVIVAPQIAYLPTLYGAYNRRETEVSVLNQRAGVPGVGTRTAGTHALRARVGPVDARYAAQPVCTVGTLGCRRRRHPHRLSAIGAVPLVTWADILGDLPARRDGLGGAVPGAGPGVRAGCTPLASAYAAGLCALPRSRGQWASTCPTIPIRSAGSASPTRSSSTRLPGCARWTSRSSGEPADAWPDFVGWRVNYEGAAYAVAAAIDAVPALWSGPRRRTSSTIGPILPGHKRDR